MDQTSLMQVGQSSCDLSTEMPSLLLGDDPAIAEKGIQILCDTEG